MKKLLITTLGTVALTGCFSDTNKHLKTSILAIDDDPKHESIVKRGGNYIIQKTNDLQAYRIWFQVETATLPMDYISGLSINGKCEVGYHTSAGTIEGEGYISVSHEGYTNVVVRRYQEILDTGRTISKIDLNCSSDLSTVGDQRRRNIINFSFRH